MNSFGGLYRASRVSIKRNGSLISSLAAAAGVGLTAYLTAKASFKAARIIDENEKFFTETPTKEKVKLVWRFYIPPTLAGVSTVLLIGNANRLATNKQLAAQAALAVTQRAYTEYRDQVVKEFGERKDETIRANVAEERMKKNPPPSTEIMTTGPGMVLCCELYTGRYFACSMESLKRAENTLNSRLLRNGYATMDDFYDMVGLGMTSKSGESGWRPEDLMKLEFATVLSDDGRPCLSFDYNYVIPIL